MASLSPQSNRQQNKERSRAAARPGFFRQVGDDLRRRHNLELYLTVTVCLGIALLNLFSVVGGKVVGAATLAVLALLAVSGLVTRRQSEEVGDQLGQIASEITGEVPADRFLKARMPQLDEDIKTASDIGLVGVTLTRTVRDILPILGRRLQMGAKARVLVIDAEGPARSEAIARAEGADSPNFFEHRVASTIDLLRVLASAEQVESALQVGILPYVPTFGMCLVDPDQAHGRIHVEIYQHRTIEQNPCFTLRADSDHTWYQLFAAQFETLWHSAKVIALNAPEPGGVVNPAGP